MDVAAVMSDMDTVDDAVSHRPPPCGIVGSSPDNEKDKVATSAMDSGEIESNSRSSPHTHSDLNFDIRLNGWSPNVPTGFDFSYSSTSHPFNIPDSEDTLHEFVGKIRRPKSRLYCRRGAVVFNKNPLGKDHKGERKLRHVASKGDIIEVRRLLDDGINPNRADDKGRAPLHFAVTKGYQDLVQILLDKGADVNLKDGVGNTPLHLAVFSNQMGVVTTLLESGANTHELDKAGHTPVHLARSRLKHIKESACTVSCFQLQKEVVQLVSMLKVYMSSIGLAEHIIRLDQLSLQVQESSAPNEQVDAIEDILNSFTSLSLQKP